MRRILSAAFLATFVLSATALAGNLHLTQIQAVKESGANKGVLSVEVTYLRHCNDEFLKLVTTEIEPLVAAAPNIAVMVLVQDTGIACAAADVEETVKFELASISGAYQYHLIQP